jgi:hypothetical protein
MLKIEKIANLFSKYSFGWNIFQTQAFHKLNFSGLLQNPLVMKNKQVLDKVF